MLRMICCLSSDSNPNPLDDVVIEQALLLREAHGGAIHALAAGGEAAQRALRHALALGVDAATRLDVPQAATRDPWRLLAHAAQSLPWDLMLVATACAETNRSDGPAQLAERLHAPLLPFVREMELRGAAVRAWCDYGEVLLEMAAPMPLILSPHASLNTPRLPRLSQIVRAKKMPIREIAPVTAGGGGATPTLMTAEGGGSTPTPRRHRIFDAAVEGNMEAFAQAVREEWEGLGE